MEIELDPENVELLNSQINLREAFEEEELPKCDDCEEDAEHELMVEAKFPKTRIVYLCSLCMETFKHDAGLVEEEDEGQ